LLSEPVLAARFLCAPRDAMLVLTTNDMIDSSLNFVRASLPVFGPLWFGLEIPGYPPGLHAVFFLLSSIFQAFPCGLSDNLSDS